MDSERAAPDAAVAGGGQDEVVWSRVWERPGWMEPRLPAVRGWRPGRRTLALLLVLFFVPGVIGGLAELVPDVDFARGAPTTGGLFAEPAWLRIYYGAQVGLTAAGVITVAGALAMLLWRRAGAAVAAAGLLVDAAGHVTVLVAYVRSGVAPGGGIAQVVAEVVSRLLLLGLALLVLLPRGEAAAPPAEPPFAPPAP